MSDDKMREAFEAWALVNGYAYRNNIGGFVCQLYDPLLSAWRGATQAQALAEAQQRGREIATGIAKCVEKGDRMDDEPLFIYEHDDGHHWRTEDARLVGDPAWHRVGPVEAEVDPLAFLSGPCRLAVRRFAPQHGQTEAEFIRSAVISHLRQVNRANALLKVMQAVDAYLPFDWAFDCDAQYVGKDHFRKAVTDFRAAMRATPADGGEG